MMLRVCSWCRWPLGIKRGRIGVTHGICAPCARRVQRCPETSWPARLARAIEAAADAACWLVIIAGYLLGMAMLYAALERSAHGGGTVEVVATAYSWRERSHRKWGDRNALGSSLQGKIDGLAQIAVDPRRIPLGSIVEVEGLGRRIATDTGGLIVGGKIDIHWQSVGDMRAWGTRRVEIEVIRRGWGGAKICGGGVENRRHAPDVRRGHAKTGAKAQSVQNRVLMALDSKGRIHDRRTAERPVVIIALDSKGRSKWTRG